MMNSRRDNTSIMDGNVQYGILEMKLSMTKLQTRKEVRCRIMNGMMG